VIKRALAVLAMLAPFLLLGNSAEAAGYDRLEKQEGCERLCVQCMDREDKKELCMALYRMCCRYHGGHMYPGCGCRVEM